MIRRESVFMLQRFVRQPTTADRYERKKFGTLKNAAAAAFAFLGWIALQRGL